MSPLPSLSILLLPLLLPSIQAIPSYAQAQMLQRRYIHNDEGPVDSILSARYTSESSGQLNPRDYDQKRKCWNPPDGGIMSPTVNYCPSNFNLGSLTGQGGKSGKSSILRRDADAGFRQAMFAPVRRDLHVGYEYLESPLEARDAEAEGDADAHTEFYMMENARRDASEDYEYLDLLF